MNTMDLISCAAFGVVVVLCTCTAINLAARRRWFMPPLEFRPDRAPCQKRHNS